jgi:hypothetical protein
MLLQEIAPLPRHRQPKERAVRTLEMLTITLITTAAVVAGGGSAEGGDCGGSCTAKLAGPNPGECIAETGTLICGNQSCGTVPTLKYKWDYYKCKCDGGDGDDCCKCSASECDRVAEALAWTCGPEPDPCGTADWDESDQADQTVCEQRHYIFYEDECPVNCPTPKFCSPGGPCP